MNARKGIKTKDANILLNHAQQRQKKMNARKGIKTMYANPWRRAAYLSQKKMNARKGIKTAIMYSMLSTDNWSEEDECPQGH